METLSVPKTTERLSKSDDVIHWKQLWSLAALYGSVIIGWIAYQNYQPRLLVQFAFTDFTFLLMAAQGIILVITPLIAGRLGDRFRAEKGHRLPVITSGISFAAMVFMAVAFTLLGNPGEVFKWVLPGLIVLWLIAMSIFTSPALSTMELFTPVDKLPHAMAILTITANLIYSLEPVIVDIIDYLGAPITFMLGGVAVFLSGYALKRNSLGLFQRSGDREAPPSETKLLKSPHGFIFFLGLAVGTATAILFYLFPILLEEKLGVVLNADGKFIVVGILLLSALLSLPVSKIIRRYGMERIFWMSFTAIVLTTLAIYLLSSPILVLILVVAFSITFTALSVASLPFAISRSAFLEKVFCVGIFFSGVALPEGVWEAWLAYSA
ncbi:MAG: MFS transporter [Cyclobacteriaceae bacterium]